MKQSQVPIQDHFPCQNSETVSSASSGPFSLSTLRNSLKSPFRTIFPAYTETVVFPAYTQKHSQVPVQDHFTCQHSEPFSSPRSRSFSLPTLRNILKSLFRTILPANTQNHSQVPVQDHFPCLHSETVSSPRSGPFSLPTLRNILKSPFRTIFPAYTQKHSQAFSLPTLRNTRPHSGPFSLPPLRNILVPVQDHFPCLHSETFSSPRLGPFSLPTLRNSLKSPFMTIFPAYTQKQSQVPVQDHFPCLHSEIFSNPHSGPSSLPTLRNNQPMSAISALIVVFAAKHVVWLPTGIVLPRQINSVKFALGY